MQRNTESILRISFDSFMAFLTVIERSSSFHFIYPFKCISTNATIQVRTSSVMLHHDYREFWRKFQGKNGKTGVTTAKDLFNMFYFLFVWPLGLIVNKSTTNIGFHWLLIAWSAEQNSYTEYLDNSEQTSGSFSRLPSNDSRNLYHWHWKSLGYDVFTGAITKTLKIINIHSNVKGNENYTATHGL